MQQHLKINLWQPQVYQRPSNLKAHVIIIVIGWKHKKYGQNQTTRQRTITALPWATDPWKALSIYPYSVCVIFFKEAY